MDWSPEAVFDYGARTHRRGLRWRQKKLLLWPIAAWRVVAPETRERKLNPLQRVVLRFHKAGLRSYADAAEHLGLEAELVAYVAQELQQMNLLNADGSTNERADRFLEASEIDPSDLAVGWVFQDTFTGRLLPRFLKDLPTASCEPDDKGRPYVSTGSKGRPFRQTAFVVPTGNAFLARPTPEDILHAALRHRRHEKRARRARMETGAEAPKLLEHIALVSETPEQGHLVTFLYVPDEEREMEELPWFVADPFGFGASPEMRDHLETLRCESSGSFRDLLDRITGEAMDQRREHWAQMQQLLRSEARKKADEALPRGSFAGDERVRERLEDAFLELERLEHSDRAGRLAARDIETAYLRLRQAIEEALVITHKRHPPGSAWRKIDRLPKRASSATVTACAAAIGFTEAQLPRAVQRARAGTVQFVCTSEPGGRVRPTLTAFVLAASDDPAHPLRTVAVEHPTWLKDVDNIAEAAGGQVHAGGARRNLDLLQEDISLCIRVLRTLLNALGTH